MANADISIGSFTSYNFQENLIISSFSTYTETPELNIGSIGQFYADQNVGSIGQFYSDISIGSFAEIPDKPVYHFTQREIGNDIIIKPYIQKKDIVIHYAKDYYSGKYKESTKDNSPELPDNKKMMLKCDYLQDKRVAETIEKLIREDLTKRKFLVTITHDFRSMYVTIGDEVAISHLAGVGMFGWTEQKGIVIAKRSQRQREIQYDILITLDRR